LSSSIQYVYDSLGNVWQITANTDGSINSTQMPPGFVVSTTSQLLVDSTGAEWYLSVNSDGSLQTSPSTTIPVLPPGYADRPSTTVVNNILTSVKQDIEYGVSNLSVLLDYVDRIQKRMLRESQWAFLQSPVKRFITVEGINTYWIGPGNAPSGTADTGLQLPDVGSVWTESVWDRTNNRQLIPLLASSESPEVHPDASQAYDAPRMFSTSILEPNTITLFPLPNSNCGYQPTPPTPICSTQNIGTQPGRTYYVGLTIVDSAGNESTVSTVPRMLYLPAGQGLVVQAPQARTGSSTGVTYDRYNVYVGTSPSTMTKQNGTTGNGAFQEPTTGLAHGANPPTTNSTIPQTGYLMEFRYYQKRVPITTVTQTVQIPDIYRDVLIAGVNYLVAMYLSRQEDRDKVQFWKGEFMDGLRQMRKDLNLSFRNTNYISPDAAFRSSRNGISGYLIQ
jgi:hypothetical protein